MNRTLRDVLVALFWLIIVLAGVIYVGVLVLNETQQHFYQECCFDNGGEILVTALDCPNMPSECAYCSIEIDPNKDCKKYNLTMVVD